MIFRFIIIFILLAQTAWAYTCSDIHYVDTATSGAADCSSASDACLLATALTNVAADECIEMADGTYQGANSMLDPTDGKSGLSGSPIVVYAANDGGVLIDGQDVRRPCFLRGNDYWDIEGINCANSNESTYYLQGSSNVITKRVVAWDATISGNEYVFSNTSSGTYGFSQDNLFEDVAWFGTGRKGFCCGERNTTIRRAWGAFGSSSNTGPKMAISLFYNSIGVLVENSLFTVAENSADNNQFYGSIAMDNMDGEASQDPDVQVLGSIAYQQSGISPTGRTLYISNVDGVDLQDVVTWYAPSYTDKTNFLGNCSGSPTPACGNDPPTITDTTLIGADGGNTIQGDWTQTNVEPGPTVGAVTSIYTNTPGSSGGAAICYQYVDGVLTSTPLWPWPMDDRIKAAILASGGSLTTYFGGSDNGPTDLVESIFGTIPNVCRSDAVSFMPGVTLTGAGFQ